MLSHNRIGALNDRLGAIGSMTGLGRLETSANGAGRPLSAIQVAVIRPFESWKADIRLFQKANGWMTILIGPTNSAKRVFDETRGVAPLLTGFGLVGTSDPKTAEAHGRTIPRSTQLCADEAIR